MNHKLCKSYKGRTMKYAKLDTSAVCVEPGVPKITLKTVNEVLLLIVYVNSPVVTDPFVAILCKKIKSPVAIFVFEITADPNVKTPVPAKSVAAPALI